MFQSASVAGSSHRGVDLGPMRLSMPSGLLRRVQGTDTGSRRDIATASLAVRYADDDDEDDDDDDDDDDDGGDDE